jgi:hypothetical protein
MMPKAVYTTYLQDLPEFLDYQDYTALNFAGKLKSARERACKKKDRASEDADFFAHDRKIFPRATVDWKGEEYWKGSAAHKALVEDIKAGKHRTHKPKALHASRDIYITQCADKDRFRNRIYQEEKAIKRIQYIERQSARKRLEEEEAEAKKVAAKEKKEEVAARKTQEAEGKAAKKKEAAEEKA